MPATGPDVDRDVPLDAHLHTDLSPDSDVPIDAYCAAAVERGVPEIAITDHLDFDPRDPAFAYADFPRRERIVRDAAARWADHGLVVRFGVEITYESGREKEIRNHLAGHAYDYAIGSVHASARSPYARDHVAAWVAGRSLVEIAAPYFSEVVAAARSGLFDILGHLDYVKKYVAAQIPPGDFAAVPELYEPVLRALVESGTGLEVNSSGLRNTPRETYPAAWVVRRFRELGGTRVTTGSDAHRASWFAHGLDHACAVAAAAGFDDLVMFRGAGAPPALPRAARLALPARFRTPASGFVPNEPPPAPL